MVVKPPLGIGRACPGGKYLEQHPAPDKGMERIQAFEQAQMFADELVLHDIVYN